MNEKTARQITEMKKQTIGVEVEMNNITRQKAAKAAAEFFGTGRYENTAGRNGYSTWSRVSGKFPQRRTSRNYPHKQRQLRRLRHLPQVLPG